MAVLKNRAGVSTATSGTGTVTLGSAIPAGVSPFVAGWQTLAAAGVANGDSVRYLILDVNGAWEYGTGTYTSAGTTLSRAAGAMDGTVPGQKSSTGALLALSGNAQVFVTAVAEDIPPVGGLVPQGRLTLASATPVMTATVSGATTVFYTPYVGQFVPIYNGASFVMADIGGELSQTLADTAKSPAAAAANSNYDYFVWDDAGTKRCTRGPPWSSDTVRGTGAGTTELQRQNGIWLNKNAITNGPGALRGTYVGTVRSFTGPVANYKFGTQAAGGGQAIIGVWNCYNRVNVSMMVQDSTASWTYASATWQVLNSSATWSVVFIAGLGEDMWRARAAAQTLSSATGVGYSTIGLDSGAGTGPFGSQVPVINQGLLTSAEANGYTPGFHTLYHNGFSTSGTITYYGGVLSHLSFDWRC